MSRVLAGGAASRDRGAQVVTEVPSEEVAFQLRPRQSRQREQPVSRPWGWNKLGKVGTLGSSVRLQGEEEGGCSCTGEAEGGQIMQGLRHPGTEVSFIQSAAGGQ